MATEIHLQNGRVTQVIGPVVDVEFPPGGLPEVYTALAVTNPAIDDRPDTLIVEVAQHLGENTARCIAMDSTDGLVRGMAAKNTGANITMPVGKGVLGRILNVVGDPVDELGPVQFTKRNPIHRPPRAAAGRQIEAVETGVKVIDLRALPPRRQDRPLRRRRGGQDRAPHGAHPERGQGARRLLRVRRRG
jgi:F-type H+-transporting ATPase subunit beta